MAVAPSNSNRVYALIEAKEGGLFRSDDGGAKWERISAHRALRQRHWYYTVLTVDPTNADVVWFPQVPLLKSIDGGKTVTQVKGTHHGDSHDLWIDPKEPQRLIVGNDGGLDISFDGGRNWFDPPLPTGAVLQHRCRRSRALPRRRHDAGLGYGQRPVALAREPGLGAGRRGQASALADWIVAGGGEAGDFVYDRSQPGSIFASEYAGIITHYQEGTGQTRAGFRLSREPVGPARRAAEVSLPVDLADRGLAARSAR